ncbi:enoyl-ACP reductase FabI [Calditerrivibrio nitroreducens]|uniref:Enoyl-[acyl-carrier-protein] reductase [NADH] n=1 Tax=Calditerrivibrio nitroreducens (strain DSM 19672 / NBRC 101217 / Yu37-1) TaxID=768670 RepID=E4THX8_CALNY|nr:enoyl-ACP reductase [Calditerrivibrio nitroreducens]ADR18908.1 Enoyl-(acyl-carrier-protein) reductase (NADH) [Calditerrivibrio nitroreducens DSM 19672]
MRLLEGKNAVIFGVANDKSIAYAISKLFKENGANLGFTYAGEALKKRVEPISEELGGKFCIQCDVSKDEDILSSAQKAKELFGKVDIIVHSVAYAPAEALKGRFVDTPREGFKIALDISAYSLVAICKAYEEILSDNASIVTMTYYGSVKVVQNYNVMGVAKAALESSVRYLANDLGPKGVRVNAISAGPIKTLAASGISGFKSILSQIEEKAPLKKNVTQEDVAKAALFLCSDLGSGVTGDILYVDSGYNILGL